MFRYTVHAQRVIVTCPTVGMKTTAGTTGYNLHLSGGASSRWMYPDSETSRGQIAPISPSAPSPVAWSSANSGWLRCPGECTVGAVQYTFFHWGGMTRRQSYSSLHSPETLRATLDH